jgi:ubiquinone biosynthesis protein Coq4
MSFRAWLVTRLFELSQIPYTALAKRHATAWQLSSDALLTLGEHTLGHALGAHLKRFGFELMPKLEDHDVLHLLTGVGVSVPEEIELQCVLLGNGKRSSYCLAVVLLGSVLYPDELGRFRRAFGRGRQLGRFFDLPFRRLLARPITEVTARLAPRPRLAADAPARLRRLLAAAPPRDTLPCAA